MYCRSPSVESWSALSASLNDETIGLVGRAIKVPRVILLVAYDRMPKRRVRFFCFEESVIPNEAERSEESFF